MANPKLSYIKMGDTTLDINDAATAKTASKNSTAIVSIRTALNGFDVDGKHSPGLKDKVSNLQADVAGMYKRVVGGFDLSNVVMIGDSYAAGANTTAPSTDNWCVQLAKLLDITNYRYYSNGGGGFITSGAAGGNFTYMLSSSGNVYKSESKDAAKVTMVIIMGGINDGNVSEGNMSSAVTNTITAAKQLFPNARLLLSYNFFWKPYPIGQSRGIEMACNDAGIPFVDIAPWAMADSNEMYTDNVHPNSAGVRRFTAMLAAYIRGYRNNVPHRKLISYNGFNCRWWVQGGELRMMIAGTATNTANDGRVIKGIPIASYTGEPLSMSGRGYNDTGINAYTLIKESDGTSSIAVYGGQLTSGTYLHCNLSFPWEMLC